jgi:Protein of unknown function (DUF2934)
MQDIEQATREHAYHLWVADGRPDGNAEQYWLTAQREVLAASLKEIGRVKVSNAAARAASERAAPPKDNIAAKSKVKRKVA